MQKSSKPGILPGNRSSSQQPADVGYRFKRLDELLNKATNLARIGVWEVDSIKRALYWSDITRDIHEAEPGFEPDIETAINFYNEGNDRTVIVQKMEDAIKNCTPFDVELQIVTAKG